MNKQQIRGLIEAEDCPNILSVTIGDAFSASGVRPLVAHGVFGMLETGKGYHLMIEDDCHYRSVSILSEGDIEDIKESIMELMKNISVKNNKKTKRPDWKKAKIKPNTRDTIKKGRFVSGFKKKDVPLISIDTVEGVHILEFHPFWYDSLIKTLDMVENPPRQN